MSVALIKSSAEEETDLNSYFNAGSLKNILTLPTTCRQSFDRKCLGRLSLAVTYSDGMMCNRQGKAP